VEDLRPEFAAMTSRGSALRRRVETLLNDAPRRHRRRPWLAVTSVALPAVCLAPVITIASLARVPPAAARLVRQTQASEAPAERAVSVSRRAEPRAAARSSKTGAPTPIAAATDRTPVAESAADQLSDTLPPSTPVGQVFEPPAVPSAPSTRLRDAIAAARIPPEPASSRTRLDVSDPERRGLSRIARYIGFDTTRPKLDVPNPAQLALRRAEQMAFDTPRRQ
jgi:hypothetical protein